MALKKTMTLNDNFGEQIAFDETYVKVEDVGGTKENVSATVNIYKAKGGQFLFLFRTNFTPSMEGGNFIRQTYDHLKTLPEFAGAADC